MKVGICEYCGETRRLTRHHKSYFVDPKYGRESDIDRPENIEMLCWPCHQGRHRDNPTGEYWRDCEEMANYWESYYDAMEKD
jgi:hypothetical protein